MSAQNSLIFKSSRIFILSSLKSDIKYTIHSSLINIGGCLIPHTPKSASMCIQIATFSGTLRTDLTRGQIHKSHTGSLLLPVYLWDFDEQNRLHWTISEKHFLALCLDEEKFFISVGGWELSKVFGSFFCRSFFDPVTLKVLQHKLTS